MTDAEQFPEIDKLLQQAKSKFRAEKNKKVAYYDVLNEVFSKLTKVSSQFKSPKDIELVIQQFEKDISDRNLLTQDQIQRLESHTQRLQQDKDLQRQRIASRVLEIEKTLKTENKKEPAIPPPDPTTVAKANAPQEPIQPQSESPEYIPSISIPEQHQVNEAAVSTQARPSSTPIQAAESTENKSAEKIVMADEIPDTQPPETAAPNTLEAQRSALSEKIKNMNKGNIDSSL